MIFISWNARGLGNPCSVQVLKDLVLIKRPKVDFLMETKVDSMMIEYVRSVLGFPCSFVVNSNGNSGGVALFWKDDNSIRIVSSSSNYIDAIFNFDFLGSWRFTGFYGFPKRTRRRQSWDLIQDLASH